MKPTSDSDIEYYIEKYKRMLRNTKVKGKRLFLIIKLVELGSVTKKQISEMEKIKENMSDWKLEAEYYGFRYWQSEEQDYKNMIDKMFAHDR